MTAATRAALVLVALLATATARAQETPGVESLERATCVIARIHGSTPQSAPEGLDATPSPDADLGGATAIAPDVVVTSARLIEGGDAWVVIDLHSGGPQTPVLLAAVPMHVDLESDVAFFRVDGSLPHHVPLPERAAPVDAGARVTFAGFRGWEPGRSTGRVISVADDGRVRIDLHRGDHPVGRALVDEEGRWVAIVGHDTEGAATSMSAVVAAWRRRPEAPASITPPARLATRALGFLGHECESELEDALALGHDALALADPDPFVDAFVATMLARVGLCRRHEREMMEAATDAEVTLFDQSARLARRALEASPTTRAEYLALPLLAERWPLPRPAPEEAPPAPRLGFTVVDPAPRRRPRSRGGFTTTVTRSPNGPPTGLGRGTVPGMGPEPIQSAPNGGGPSWRRGW